MNHFLVFALLGGLLLVAGTVLAKAADGIAETTGIGRMWVGTILLAGATSLPEAATDVSAIRMGEPDLAAGDLFGSCMANMFILAIVDLLPPRGRVLAAAGAGLPLMAALAIVMVALATMFVAFPTEFTVLGVGPGPFLLGLTYVLGSRMLYRAAPPAETTHERRGNVARPIAAFVGAALVVVAVSPAFARAAQGIAEVTGLGTTFVGSTLVGLSTSLPELVASVAAVRMGAYELAVGNLFGSNAFNMAIFFVLDLAHPGALMAALHPDHALTGLLAILLMGFGLAAGMYQPPRRVLVLDPDSLLILAFYLAGIAWLYARSVGG